MKQIKTVLLIIGTIIGAGFVSGKEISSFFSVYGYYSLLFILPIFFIFYFIFNKLLFIGAKNNIENVDDLNLIIFKKNNKIIKIFTFISFIILAATMFSSFNISLHFDFLSKQQIIFLSIITIISCIIICHDISVIKNICTIVIPIILILMLSICFSNFNIPQNNVVSNIILLPYNTITYVCRNIFLSYFVICKSSKGFTEKQCKQVSFFTSLILCCVLSIVLVIEINPDLVLSSMPLLDLAQNSILYYPYLIGLLFAVFTTLISTLVTLKSFFHFRSNFLNALCPTLICVLLSFIKFDYFVVYLYPIIGIFGFYLLYYLMSFDVFFQNSNKNIHKASKQTKNKRT